MQGFEKLLPPLDGTDAQLPGLAAFVLSDKGQDLYSCFWGKLTLDTNSPPLTESATVSLASAGKFLTHIALLQLVERGLVTLDDLIAGILPELKDVPVITPSYEEPGYTLQAAARPMTIRHLMTNSSGMMDDSNTLLELWRDNTGPPVFPDDTSPIIKTRRRPLEFDPGEGWNYGHEVHFLQVVIERLSGQTFQSYMQEHLFDRLGMTATSYRPDQHPHIDNARLQMGERGENGEIRSLPAGTVGGLTSSISDLKRLFTDLISASPVLIRSDTRGLLFQAGLESSGMASKAFLSQASDFAKQVGLLSDPLDSRVSYSVAGAMIVQDGTGLNLPTGTLTWDGMPNVAWAIHLEKRLAMVFAMQLLPEYDEATMPLRMEFFRSACRAFGEA